MAPRTIVKRTSTPMNDPVVSTAIEPTSVAISPSAAQRTSSLACRRHTRNAVPIADAISVT